MPSKSVTKRHARQKKADCLPKECLFKRHCLPLSQALARAALYAAW